MSIHYVGLTSCHSRAPLKPSVLVLSTANVAVAVAAPVRVLARLY